MKVNNNNIKIQIWDTSGQPQYREIIKTYLNNVNICLIVFDLSNKISFYSLEKWINDVKLISKNKIIIIGNKYDLNLDFPLKEFLSLKEKYNLDYILLSLETGDINELDNKIYEYLKSIKIISKESINVNTRLLEDINLDSNQENEFIIKNKKKDCCSIL